MEADDENGYVIRLSSLFTDRDAFIILHDLAQRRQPATSAFLARAYGIDPRDMNEILLKLTQLRFARRRGYTFAAAPDALLAVEFLRDVLAGVSLEAALSESAGSTLSVTAARANGSPEIVAAHTNNGTWATAKCTGVVLSSVAHVAKARESATGTTRTATKIEDQGKGQTADASDARDHAYL